MTTDNQLANAFSQLILSASGWRKVFAVSGKEDDARSEVSSFDKTIFHIASLSFLEFLDKRNVYSIIVGRDSRPTGRVLEALAFSTLSSVPSFDVRALGVVSAPEIMASARLQKCAFMYISASHNPIGHNGLKFGLPTGGVVGGEDSKELIALFTEKMNAVINGKKVNLPDVNFVLPNVEKNKATALSDYTAFSREVISASDDLKLQNRFFDEVKSAIKARGSDNPISVVCDFNGSARSVSIDRAFFTDCGIKLFSINEECGKIVHGIIPEGKNLNFCAEEMSRLYGIGEKPVLGYMPDCDGDRGNIIYWNNEKNVPVVLSAQDVFALSVMAELSFLKYVGMTEKPVAVAVNGPTSLRIEAIAEFFGAKVFRAEVGEANVVSLAHQLVDDGYTVRILGEGSNGGNITLPASVRDPLNTIFAILKLLLLKGDDNRGLFYLWCEVSNQTEKYCDDFSLYDIIKTLPEYTTTPTQEPRALLKINTKNHSDLKAVYKTIFEKEWAEKKDYLKQKLGIVSYKAITNNGKNEVIGIDDFSVSGKGGLKIQFYDVDDKPVAFIWMRGSGTEPVFRIMCDVKGNNPEQETELVLWQGNMVKEADLIISQK